MTPHEKNPFSREGAAPTWHPAHFERAKGFTTRSSQLKRLKEQDEQAWREFYDKYSAMITAVGARMGLDAQAREDLLQEVMQICSQRLRSFFYLPERCRFRRFLLEIVKNVAFNIRRKNDRLLPSGLSVGDYETISDLDVKFMHEYETFLLEQSLKVLERTVESGTFLVFELLVLEKQPVEEVVRRTGKTPGAIYSIKHRCLKKLDGIIGELTRQPETPQGTAPGSEGRTSPRPAREPEPPTTDCCR